MRSTLAALCAISFIGVCFMARIPIPEKIPKYTLSNIRGLPNIRGQPAEEPREVPVYVHLPAFDKEDEMFEGGPPPKRKNPEKYDLPDDDFGKFPVPGININDIDREEPDYERVDEIPIEIPKPFDEEAHEKGEEIPVEDNEISKDAEDSDKEVPEDLDKELPEDLDKEAPEDLDKEVFEDVDEDHKTGTEIEEEVQPGGLNSPFFDIDQMRRFFDLVERAMDKVFRQTIEEAEALNGTVTNTTEEVVDINGHKYKVVKSIIKSGDYNSSIFIEAVETTLESNRTKRSNWYSEEAQTTDDSDP